jgi:hypothetical protein
MGAGNEGLDELRHVIPGFDGAWPYLELIAACTGRKPLDPQVVEAYWLGNPLLEKTDLLRLGNSVEERFRRRAALNWSAIAEGLSSGALPTHSFHVFCIYPWAGLLREGLVDPSLRVLDRCRIRWGRVESIVGSEVLVRSQSLQWDGRTLRLGAAEVETVLPPVATAPLHPGDLVAMHWDYICQKITRRQLDNLERYHSLHLGIANGGTLRLASVF